ncbi:MAG TPA: carbohydrate ABC transporter permease [Armatimonadota bacterium]|nr:carbohydrate ABC transporter permease [Armatimonadota bacterium]HOM82546.1 carbohydrate ABC transporter permease [Armatimonadota bacterium]HPO73271.1 carbohydrate ABC transporter permease [Armatimonadota bacterium]HPT96948.1 carbohydrate ABC transporter permease [Armatimonadota bacterium]
MAQTATSPARQGTRWGRVVTFVLLCLGSAIFSIPFIWTVSTALKTKEQVFAVPPVWIPNPVQWENFRRAWTELPFPTFVFNTVLITLISVVGQVTSASLVAYGFARFRFKGRTFLFYLLLSTMMLPAQVTMIPVFLIWRALGLIDTFAPMTVPAFFGGGAFTIFLLRQFFMTVPRELDEAAMIDGCSYFGIWWRILLPLSRPALVTVTLFSFLAHWDDFMGPLIYLNSMEKYTVSIGLRMFQDMFGTELELLMAASLIHILPTIVLFFIGQRYFIKGIALTGLKG